MREIARKEDNKNIQWYYPKQNVIQDGQFFTLPFVRTPDDKFVAYAAGAMSYVKVSDFGDIMDSQLVHDGQGDDLSTKNTIRLKGIQGNFEVRWGGPLPVDEQADPHAIVEMYNYPGTLQLAIIELPAGMMWTNGAPSITAFKPTTAQYRGYWENTVRQSSTRPFRVLARKTIHLACPKLYMPAFLADGANGTNANFPVYQWMRKNVSINKWFKGLGKKLTIDPSFNTIQTKEVEYFVAWTSDIDFRLVGTVGTKIRLDQPQLQVQPGNP